MSTRSTRRTVAAMLSLTLLAAMAGGAAAATTPFPQDFSFDERGLRAEAYWQNCQQPDTEGITRCVSMSASVFDGRQHSRDPEFGHVNDAFAYLCVFRSEEAFDADGGAIAEPRSEGGCILEPDIVADGLDSLDVSASLELIEEVCVIIDPGTGETVCEPGSARTVEVNLSITGTGEVLTDRWLSRGTSIVDGVRCQFLSASSGTGRDAEASILVGAEDPGGSQFAFLADGRTRMSQRCAG
ncbi:MAG: hypothetical protein M3Y40_10170 [Chloroflexota bacterium]|nr:hypothetical protein [Chloroflexota bacterium]